MYGERKLIKRHTGVQREFTRLAQDELGIDKSFLVFLSQAYNLKAVADYEQAPALLSLPNAPPPRLRRRPGSLTAWQARHFTRNGRAAVKGFRRRRRTLACPAGAV